MKIEDIKKELGNMSEDELHTRMADHCRSMLKENDLKIYDEALGIFTKKECDSTVLSILVMNYGSILEHSTFPIKDAIEQHSELYTPFEIDMAMCWTLSRIFDMPLNKAVKECKIYFPQYTKSLNIQ